MLPTLRRPRHPATPTPTLAAEVQEDGSVLLTPSYPSVSGAIVAQLRTAFYREPGHVLVGTTDGVTPFVDTEFAVDPPGDFLPPDLAAVGFEDGTDGVLTNPWGSGITYVDDPTGSGRGKVARLAYAPAVGLSHELAEKFTPGAPIRYGVTIWARVWMYLPLSPDGETHNRKLLDFQGGGVRMTLNRQGRDLRWSMVDWMTGAEAEIAGSTGFDWPSDEWVAVEVKMKTNSADAVRDGELEVYINGADTPTWSKYDDLGWITEAFPGGSYFDGLMFGFQLTIPSGAAYTEVRYLDDIAVSTTRPGT